MSSRLSAMSVAAWVALLATMSVASAGLVDESALREYARQNRSDRVAAETRRLERLHPQWRPPADLWTARASGPDEAPLWDLFETSNPDELRKAIAERQSREPDWQPSDDLVAKIKARDIRTAILDRAASGKWIEVARIAGDNGLIGGTQDVELLWVVAEALVHTERASEAAALYRFVLENRTDPAERLATVQKALATLRMAEAEKLIAMGATGADGKSEFDPIRLDIARARISAFLRSDPSNAVEASDLAALEELARHSSDPGQSGLLAWYAYRRGQYDAAHDWFKLSVAHGGDAMTAHGLALTLLKLGFRRDAEEVAYAWREQLTNNMILFIDILETDLTREVPPFVEPARLSRYAQVTTKTQSGEGAQALAWYAYNTCQFETAHEWFQRAVAWFPKEATIYGYGLTLQHLKKHHEFVEIANRYDGLFPRVVGLLFKDDYIHPPTPCENGYQAAAYRSQPRLAPDAYRATSSLAQDPGHSPGLVSRPAKTGDPYASRRIVRADFPLPVSPENPLRFSLRGGMPLDRASKFGQSFRAEGPLNPPRIARRVPGTEAMPYERFGVALLPAYDGTTTLSFRAMSYRSAAAGTIWSEESATAGREASMAPQPAQRPLPQR
jgi:cellulose synthase operon protein C